MLSRIFYLKYKKEILGARIVTCAKYTSASKMDRLHTRISADNNIYANDKRAKLHSAQDAGNKSVQRPDIPGRRRALCLNIVERNHCQIRCAFVLQLVYIVTSRWNENTEHRKTGNSDVGRMRKICVPGVQGITIKILFLTDNIFLRLKTRKISIPWRKRQRTSNILGAATRFFSLLSTYFVKYPLYWTKFETHRQQSRIN